VPTACPFLADSYDEAAKLWKVQKPLLDKKLGDGMMLLYAVPWPPQGIYAKKPLASAADLKGMKWRAYSPATARIAELVGAQPVTVQAAELSQAMATGVIESYMSSGSTGFDTKTYEHIKYWYDTQAWLPKNAVMVNKKAFDALDKPTQDALLKAAADAEARGLAASKKANGETLEKLKANGMTILPPSAAAQGRHEEGGRCDAQGMAGKGRPEGNSWSTPSSSNDRCAHRRRFLMRSTSAPPLAALFMVALLVMVLLSIISRQLQVPRAGH
jgi:TRAP-type C4-dicarboxylate transport system substrate-binding protein